MHRFRKTSKKIVVIALITAPLLAASSIFLAHLPGVVPPKGVNDSVLVFLAYFWTGTFVHEAGHALAGAMMGFRLSVFRVTPLELVVESDGRMRFAWHSKLGGGYLGQPKHVRHLSLRTAVITAGGPAANVLTFLACWFWLRTEGMFTGTGFAFVRGLMIFSLFSAVLNLAPFEYGGSKTDGRRLCEAITSGRWIE